MRKYYFYTFAVALAITITGQAQQSDLQTLPLSDLSAFQGQAGNWRVVGDVTMDRSIDSHPEEPKPAPETGKKAKKSKKEPAPPAAPKAVTFIEGNGVLLNLNDATKKDHIVTKMQHGDIELELEVMLPKGSNSGIYLQGRYEVQLLDSWGVKNAKFSDIGGIYRNWETEPGKIYMGKAPLTNAAKAPGLWQTLKISFRAPRFDNSGKKIENARFNKVILNGVLIHENVEVPLLTGSPLEKDETASGPLMIQGDHGPVAFRNIRYRPIKELNYKIGPVSYTVYHGNFKSVSEFSSVKPSVTGTTNELTSEVVDVENEYGVHYKGTINFPEDGKYMFTVASTGGTKFILNDKELFNFPTFDGSRNDTASATLKAGTYPFEILNFKGAAWLPPRLAVFVKTNDSYPKGLHATNSFPPADNPVSSIYLEPGKDPKLIRAFVDFKGNRKERLTHTIGVGDPTGLHYIYDLHSANLVCVWKGNFIDATPMWHDRGDGSFQPRGYALFLFNNQPLAYLSSDKEFFPPASKEDQFKGKGYSIDESTGRPVFHYTYQGLEFDERVFPDDSNQIMSHEIILRKGERKDGLYYKLAEGSSIQEMPDGSYAVNDKEYYIKVAGGAKPFIREANGKKELVASFPMQTLKYSIIW
jgi:hypothetical protein